MKFINRKLVWLILSLAVLALQAGAQEVKSVSKDDAEKAYETLLTVETFALGGTGLFETISVGETALETLLASAEPVEALKNLVRNATPEGAVYSLYGLRVLKCDCFDEEVKTFLAREESREKTRLGKRIRPGTVTRVTGCMAYGLPKQMVVEEIKSGRLDSYLEFKNKQKNLRIWNS